MLDAVAGWRESDALVEWWNEDVLVGGMWEHVERCKKPEDGPCVSTWFRANTGGKPRGAVLSVDCKHVVCLTGQSTEAANQALDRAAEAARAVAGSLHFSKWKARGPHVLKAIATLLLREPSASSEFATECGLCFFVPWMGRGDGVDRAEVLLLGDAPALVAAKRLLDETVERATPMVLRAPLAPATTTTTTTLHRTPAAESAAVAAAMQHAESLMHQLAQLHRQHVAVCGKLDALKQRAALCVCGAQHF